MSLVSYDGGCERMQISMQSQIPVRGQLEPTPGM